MPTIDLWTLTVDHPDSGIRTTVHPDSDSVQDELTGLWTQMQDNYRGEGLPGTDLVQELCNHGFVIYINEHQLEVN